MVSEATTVPAQDDPTGELVSAKLTLRGPLQKAFLSYSTTFSNNSFTPIFTLEALEAGSVASFTPDYALNEDSDIFDRALIKKVQEVFCLRVSHIGTQSRVVSLVLKYIEHSSFSGYQRIGIAEEFSQRETMVDKYTDPTNWPRFQGPSQIVTII
jgi:hypothetical protein